MSTGSAINMGMACHIYSAAPGGPRGQGGKDASFISSAENGIWCCHQHGTLIDKLQGKDYSAKTLFAWKKLAEARVIKRMNDIPSPLGWVESIEFIEFGEREGLPKAELSRNTLLWGLNGSGKSVLMELAASVSNGRYAKRFTGGQIRLPSGGYEDAIFQGEILYSTVDTHNKNIRITVHGNEVERAENGIVGLLPPGDIEVIFFAEKDLRRAKNEDDVQLMMRVLNVDETALFALARMGTKTLLPGVFRFEQGEEIDEFDEICKRERDDGEPYIELKFKHEKRDFYISFDQLSSSEKMRLVNDLLINKAREVAKQRLTLLLVDNTVGALDSVNFENLLRTLENEQFQSMVTVSSVVEETIISKVEGKNKLRELEYLKSWRLVDLHGLDAVGR